MKRNAVIGHCDWYSGNLRWKGDRLYVVHDWDSVIAGNEAIIVGFAAAVFPAVHAGEEAPIDETDEFLGSFAIARGRAFAPGELEDSWAAGLWLRSYDAKKQFATTGAIRSLKQGEAEERLGRAGL